MESLLIGLLNVLLYAIFFAIIVYIILALLKYFEIPVPAVVIKLIWAALAVIVLIMLIQLLLGGGVYRPFLLR